MRQIKDEIEGINAKMKKGSIKKKSMNEKKLIEMRNNFERVKNAAMKWNSMLE